MNKINNYSLFLFFCVFCMLCEFYYTNLSLSLSQCDKTIMEYAEVDMVNGHVSITNTDSKSYTNKKNGNKLLYDHNPLWKEKSRLTNIIK